MYREGEWKIVRKNGGDWELYNLEKDPTEIVDLSSENTDKVILLEGNYKTVQERFRKESR
jgi:hypothetical protein